MIKRREQKLFNIIGYGCVSSSSKEHLSRGKLTYLVGPIIAVWFVNALSIILVHPGIHTIDCV